MSNRDKYNGWVKLHRKTFISEWATDPKTNYLWIYIIAMVNSEDGTWQGIKIKRGQMVTSYAKLAAETGLSVQNIRTSIKKLILTNQLTQQTTRDYQVITVTYYDKYQEANTPDNKPTNKPINKPTNNKQEEKKRRREEDIINPITSNSLNNIPSFDFEKSFEEFWNHYPRQTEKSRAKEKYQEVIEMKIATAEQLLSSAKQYTTDTATTDPQYIKYPKSWLDSYNIADYPVEPAPYTPPPLTYPRGYEKLSKLILRCVHESEYRSWFNGMKILHYCEKTKKLDIGVETPLKAKMINEKHSCNIGLDLGSGWEVKAFISP